MREHIGAHMLRKDIPDHACGCCGGLSCQPTYKDKAACTNTPMNCEHCKEIHWKYGLQSHYETKHGDKPKPVTLGPKEAKYMKNIG